MEPWSIRLLEIRKQLNKSQKEMAEFIGIPQRTWANYESGRSEPKIKVLIALTDKGLIPDIVNSYVREIDDNDIKAVLSDEETSDVTELRTKIAELEQKLAESECHEVKLQNLEAENKKLQTENKQLSDELLEMVRRFVLTPNSTVSAKS